MVLTNELGERLNLVRQNLAAWQVEGVLIGSGSNRRWLSGFTGSAGWLLVTGDKALLGTDFRYWEQATAQAPTFELFQFQAGKTTWIDLIQAAGVGRIGLEANFVTVAQREEMDKVNGVSWVNLKSTVELWRRIKSESELALIRQAAGITDRVMAEVNELARPGQSERQLAWELEKRMRELGASEMAFEVIVASGPHSALPHHRPGERQLQLGDALVVDMGAAVNGYRSDLTRSFYLGSEPTEQYWQVYHLVLAANQKVLAEARPGMISKEIDALARDLIGAAGHADHFGHGLGHGVGLDIHEEPRLSPILDQAVIPAGVIVTVEPGVYLPGWGGVRLEDLSYVTENGFQAISQCPKNPIIPCD